LCLLIQNFIFNQIHYRKAIFNLLVICNVVLYCDFLFAKVNPDALGSTADNSCIFLLDSNAVRMTKLDRSSQIIHIHKVESLLRTFFRAKSLTEIHFYQSKEMTDTSIVRNCTLHYTNSSQHHEHTLTFALEDNYHHLKLGHIHILKISKSHEYVIKRYIESDINEIKTLEIEVYDRRHWGPPEKWLFERSPNGNMYLNFSTPSAEGIYSARLWCQLS
jgi:hypothetical protein